MQWNFLVDPAETTAAREARWDHAITIFAQAGWFLEGTGPDGDDPLELTLLDPANPAGPYVETYEMAPRLVAAVPGLESAS